MPLGPVFNAELLMTARRPRNYVIRFVYGLIILFQIYLSYQGYAWMFSAQRELSIQEMAEFGRNTFIAFALLQSVVVVLLTPALVGGAIADERQRKTLHYLLTSELSSAEIVVGKLAARLLQVVVLVALGLPVVSLIGLFGGVDFVALLLTYAATLTTIYFLATASILVSTVSRRPREAISLLYALEIIWLLVPSVLMMFMPFWAQPWPTIASWVNPWLQYVALTSPIYYIFPLASGSRGGLVTGAAWGMGLQIAYGTLFLILAALRLRPSYRNDGGPRRGWVGGLSRIARKRSWFPKPECGDDAMLWKEMNVARIGSLTKVALVVGGVALLGIIGYSGLGFLVPAAEEMSRDGYFAQGSARRDFNIFLKMVGTAIYVLWFLGIASSAASGLSSEREEDQWTSLTSTPLSGREILRAKMIGPVWGLRMVAFVLFALWGIGLSVGSIHPFGLLACLIEFAVFTWFLTAFGTFLSLRAKNSTRALASTMALLIFLNGGYMFCFIPFQVDSPIITAGSTPVIFTVSLLSVHDFGQLSAGHKSGEMIIACILGVVGYAVAAAGLTLSMFSSFDAFVDRPDRLRQSKTLNQQREYLQGRPKELEYADQEA